MGPRPSSSVLSIYRSYLRQVRLLPHIHLRHFFRIKGRDDVKAILSTQMEDLQERKARNFSKGIRKLERANNGDLKAFERILDLAYGRVGKLKWELLEPLLEDPTATLPEPIIPGVAKSRPPIYSPEMRALLTTSLARTTKPLDKKDLTSPRTLPERADPSSEDARLFGPLSKRREVNIRQRFFQNEIKKVLPPLEVEYPQPQTVQGDGEVSTSFAARKIVDQKNLLVDGLQKVIGEIALERPKPRRERSSTSVVQNLSSVPEEVDRHPCRWVRRRYRALLARIPRLIHDPQSSMEPFKVREFPLAHFPHENKAYRMRRLDPATLAWINR
ncbi:hypothetical protein CVT26_002028 [Gymnopilus dilepis]|uniref:LYR motif-containing protein Cup1-like N-terminal domain-containing protein n=1 Tax=Gymnopilus dilepis TaxID=231916 RepID=A0A409VD38_9AGAR|nr:hypothetical protein CVT26_002028 [Gymnopilus dilepis]